MQQEKKKLLLFDRFPELESSIPWVELIDHDTLLNVYQILKKNWN